MSDKSNLSYQSFLELRDEYEKNPHSLTDSELKSLKPFKVDNAIILAAGLARRFAPLSYESPKGLYKVKGEKLLERQIAQLQKAGIKKIYIVVGYKQEQFFYLEDAFNVQIIINPEFAKKNNHSSLWVSKDYLKRSYICSSDVYYEHNPFHLFEYDSFYSTEYSSGATKEWIVKTEDSDNPKIVDVTVGGENGWYMVGHAFFDNPFSKKMKSILEKEYNLPETANKLWEQLLVDHLEEFSIYRKEYERNEILEFDSVDEVLGFDPLFLENVDSSSIRNITSTLGCKPTDIHDVYPLAESLTNLSCHFSTANGEFVYRFPGPGTEKIIDRKSEFAALKAAKAAGLDSTFLEGDEDEGWKISSFIKDARTLDPHDSRDLEQAMDLCRSLHETKADLSRRFDFYEEAQRYLGILSKANVKFSEEIRYLQAIADKIGQNVQWSQEPNVFTHNDFYYPNLLIDKEGNVNLIDWEYAGIGDYANDLATFCVTCKLTDHELEDALRYYFKRNPTEQERDHIIAMIGLCAWCWYLWSLVKELSNQFIGEVQYLYYRYAKDFLKRAYKKLV